MAPILAVATGIWVLVIADHLLKALFKKTTDAGIDDAAHVGDNILLALGEVLLFQGYRIITATVNLQAGDDYYAPVMVFERWIEE